MIHIMLSLDLVNAQGTVRDDFNKGMAGYTFKKLSRVDTVWYGCVKDGVQANEVKIKSNVLDIIREITVKLKVQEVSYVVQVGNSASIGMTLKMTLSNSYTETAFDPMLPA